MRITLDELQFLVEQSSRLYVQACRFDGMPVNTKFAIFSEKNPYAMAHAKMIPRILKWNNLLTKWRLACKSI